MRNQKLFSAIPCNEIIACLVKGPPVPSSIYLETVQVMELLMIPVNGIARTSFLMSRPSCVIPSFPVLFFFLIEFTIFW